MIPRLPPQKLLPPPELAELVSLAKAAQVAGTSAMQFYVSGGQTTAEVSYKDNNSPVTAADLAADRAARQVLQQAFGNLPILSEEDQGHMALGAEPALVIDPIDGTRAFMAGRSEWCVSLALMQEGRPYAGVVYAPAREQLFAAQKGRGAFLNGVVLPRRPKEEPAPLRVTGPNRLLDTFTEHWPPMVDGETLKALAYRMASIALGSNDVAVATTGANHWDIAAADIILAETGCALLGITGGLPVYIGPNPLHPALVAAEDGLCARLTAALARVRI